MPEVYDANGQPFDLNKLFEMLGNNNSLANNVGTYGNLGLGTANLGLGIMGYLDNLKTAGKQRTIMDQQIANNAMNLATAKKRATDITKAFGSGSLAARGL